MEIFLKGGWRELFKGVGDTQKGIKNKGGGSDPSPNCENHIWENLDLKAKGAKY